MLNRRTLFAASAASGLAACARTGTPAGMLRVAIETLPDSLDPALGEFASAALVYKQIHAGLTDYAADGSVAPGIATRWRVAPDGLSWVFTLRQDARWSDGHSLTAQDVVWSALSRALPIWAISSPSRMPAPSWPGRCRLKRWASPPWTITPSKSGSTHRWDSCRH
tara:strand:- start:103537 stop:104034 length:498 start_codon:yes stop_codon:yes gene_type:complete